MNSLFSRSRYSKKHSSAIDEFYRAKITVIYHRSKNEREILCRVFSTGWQWLLTKLRVGRRRFRRALNNFHAIYVSVEIKIHPPVSTVRPNQLPDPSEVGRFFFDREPPRHPTALRLRRTLPAFPSSRWISSPPVRRFPRSIPLTHFPARSRHETGLASRSTNPVAPLRTWRIPHTRS